MNQDKSIVRFAASEHVDGFLDDTLGSPLSLVEAHAIAQHLKGCETCARAVFEKPPQRDALLDLLQMEGEKEELGASSAGGTSPGIRAYDELNVWAKSMLRQLDRDVKARLEAVSSSTSPEQTRLEALGMSRLESRAALAVAEASLTLQSLVLRSSDEQAKLGTDGTVKVGTTRVPASYLSSRISERTAVDIDLASALWTVIARLTVAGGVGLPRLAVIDRAQDSVLLTFDQDAGPPLP